MSNISLKFTIDEKWCNQNFDFISLKNSSSCQFLGSSDSRRFHWIFKLLVATQISEVWEQEACVAFLLFLFWKLLWSFKVKKSMLFVKKKFNKNETESKRKIPHTVLDRWNMCFSSYKIWKLKVKLLWRVQFL